MNERLTAGALPIILPDQFQLLCFNAQLIELPHRRAHSAPQSSA